MYYKRNIDNSILVASKVYGPTYTLDETTKNESYEGWKWFDESEAAYSYFANPTPLILPEMQAAYDAAAAVFESMPLGKQALWEPVRQAVAAAIMSGDMATAHGILSTMPVIYDGAEADRDLFLALFTP